MIYIYILKLKQGKYYIGKTNKPNVRIGNHFKMNGSVWTKRYRPVKVEKVIKTDDHFDEDKWTLKYMDMKGVNNVRGGSFCQMKLSSDVESTISRMLNGSKDRCFKCGSTEHFVKNCNDGMKLTYEQLNLQDNSDSDSSIDVIEEANKLLPLLDRRQNHCPCFCVVL